MGNWTGNIPGPQETFPLGGHWGGNPAAPTEGGQARQGFCRAPHRAPTSESPAQVLMRLKKQGQTLSLGTAPPLRVCAPTGGTAPKPRVWGGCTGSLLHPRDPLQCLPFLWMNQRPQEGTGAWKQCSAEVGSQGPPGSLPQFPLLERETPWQLGGSGGGTESGSTGLSGRTPAAEVVLEPQTSLGNSSAFTVGAQPLLPGNPGSGLAAREGLKLRPRVGDP